MKIGRTIYTEIEFSDALELNVNLDKDGEMHIYFIAQNVHAYINKADAIDLVEHLEKIFKLGYYSHQIREIK